MKPIRKYIAKKVFHSTCCACGKAPRTHPLLSPVFCKECFEKCHHCGGGDAYPWYGVAPHIHEGESIIGYTRTLPKEEWPDNFVEDPECPGLGTYYCPVCGAGKEFVKEGF